MESARALPLNDTAILWALGAAFYGLGAICAYNLWATWANWRDDRRAARPA